MNTVQIILKNTFSLLFSSIITQIIGFIVIIYLARVLGPGDFGKINFVLALLAFFLLITDLGLPFLGTREIARNTSKIIDVTNNVVSIRLYLALMSFTLFFLITYFLNKPLQVKYLILIYGTSLIPAALTLDWVFQGIERMEVIAFGRILSGFSYAIMVLLFVKTPKQLLLIPCFYIASLLVMVGFHFIIFSKRFKRPKMIIGPDSWKILLKNAWPIGLTNTMSVIIYYLDTVMLGFLRSDDEVGYYNAAYKIMLLLIMLVTPYHDSIFPLLSNYYKNSLDSMKRLQSYTVRLMVTFALPLGIGGTILARKLIHLIYGIDYSESAIALQILIWACVLIFVNTAYSRGLFAADREKQCLFIVCIQAIIAIILNLILIPEFGLIGASVATLLGEICGFIMYYKTFMKFIEIPIHNYIPKPLIASVIMGLFLCLSFDSNLFMLLILGIAIFLASLFLIKGISLEEIRVFRRTVFYR